MNTLSLRVGYRPLRIAWCLAEGDTDGLQKALRLSHTMWGGCLNPVIPINDPDLAAQMVRLFRVDLLLPISEDKAVDKFIAQFPYLPNPLHSSKLFVEGLRGERVPQVLDVHHPIRLLHEDYVKNNPEPSYKATRYEWDDDDPLNVVFLGACRAGN